MTADKQWTLTKQRVTGSVWEYGIKTIDYDFAIIPNTLLNQLRRDSVDDFLKWLGDQDLYFTDSKLRMPSDIMHQYLERAKTLGEKYE